MVEYSTVAQWVPLSGYLDGGTTFFVWKTASRGAVYHFRVVSEDATGIIARSPPSEAVSINTGGEYKSFYRRSSKSYIRILV
jgi:hypothetical protein